MDQHTICRVLQPIVGVQQVQIRGGVIGRDDNGAREHVLSEAAHAAGRRRELYGGVLLPLQLFLVV